MTIQNLFLSNTRRLMNEQNISVAGMHRSTGMSETHIAGVLIGDTGVTLRTIERFAKVFGCQPWEMIK